jgi:hypothetical protein
MDKLDSGDQTGLFYTTNPVFYTSGNRFVRRTGTLGNLRFFHLFHRTTAKFNLVFCAKYDRGLDLGFWEILKP